MHIDWNLRENRKREILHSDGALSIARYHSRSSINRWNRRPTNSFENPSLETFSNSSGCNHV